MNGRCRRLRVRPVHVVSFQCSDNAVIPARFSIELPVNIERPTSTLIKQDLVSVERQKAAGNRAVFVPGRGR